MLVVPERIVVQITNSAGSPLRRPNVLIGINTLVQGRYYYGGVVGLTNNDGFASMSAETLHAQFNRDRALFPMDYRVDLEDADPVLELIVLTPQEVEEGCRALSESFLTDSEILGLYRSADNKSVKPAFTRVIVEPTPVSEMRVAIPTKANERRA